MDIEILMVKQNIRANTIPSNLTVLLQVLEDILFYFILKGVHRFNIFGWN